MNYIRSSKVSVTRFAEKTQLHLVAPGAWAECACARAAAVRVDCLTLDNVLPGKAVISAQRSTGRCELP
jgi:hypothetical protein